MSTMIKKTYEIEKSFSPVTLKERAKIYWQYQVESPEDEQKITTLKIQTITLATVAKLSTIGGVVGATIGGIGGACVSKSVEGTVDGIKGGTVVGAAIGVSAGLYFGAKSAAVTIEKSEHFKRWKEQSIKNKVYDEFQRYVENNEDLRDLVCPITLDFPMVPVSTPNGHIFEKAAIERWLGDFKAGIQGRNCPMGGASPYGVEDLKDCRDRRIEILSALEKELKIILEEGFYDEGHIVAGLRAALADIKENHEKIMAKETQLLVAEFAKGKMSSESLLIGTTSIREKYAFYKI